MDEQKNIDQNIEASAVKESEGLSDVLAKPEIHEPMVAPPIEQPSAPLAAPAPVQTPTNIQPEPVVPADPAIQPLASPADTDLDAEEGDSIENPWVKKAEEIIERNKENPYDEEEEHEDLQIDYLKKRFGKEIEKKE